MRTLSNSPIWLPSALAAFLNIVGANRVIAESECGFGTISGFDTVDQEIAYAKLGALAARAAKRAKNQLDGAGFWPM